MFPRRGMACSRYVYFKVGSKAAAYPRLHLHYDQTFGAVFLAFLCVACEDGGQAWEITHSSW